MPRTGAVAPGANGAAAVTNGTPPTQPDLRTYGSGANGTAPTGNGGGGHAPATAPAPQGVPATGPAAAAPNGMPTVPGIGPTSATGAFPRLVAPTGHTTSWWPAVPPVMLSTPRGSFAPGYPTAVLPTRLTQ
jgi:hypothetical protein